MSTPHVDPDDERKTPPDPYVEVLVRCSDESEQVEVVYLTPLAGDLAPPEAAPRKGAEPSDGSPAT